MGVDATARDGGADGLVREFDFDGATLIAETFRAVVAPASRTFVLVHGIGMGRGVFVDLIGRLVAHGDVIAVDLPGYGEADEPPRTPSIERLGDMVARLIRESGVRGAVMVGHSMGTQVVLEAAVRHPDVASAVVLVAPTVDRTRRRAGVQFARLLLDLWGESPKVMLRGGREYLRAGPNLRRKMRAMLVHRSEDSAPHLRVPTLVMRGEDDLVVPRAWATEVAALIPGAEFAELPGLHHETLIRDAREAAERILGFVQRVPAPALP